MNNTICRLIIIALGLQASLNTMAQIPDGYYDTLYGKSGSDLKTAIHQIICNANVLDYGSGVGRTWEGFYQTDRTDDNKVIDRYSNDVREFNTKNSAVEGMNIEHSFPKSWWGGSETQAYKDLYNLMPSEKTINSNKSNYPMGTVETYKNGNDCTKVGTDSEGKMVWEPADKWKGDFARGYMYMATAYQDYTWSGSAALQILQNGDYPTLQQWAYTLYILWAKNDPIDATEALRNEKVAAIQGNRNPFVDFPNLMLYVWGDSIGYPFDPKTTVKTSTYTSAGGEQPIQQTVYTASFTSSDGGCTIENTTVPSGYDVWTRDSKYGWKGSAYNNGTRYETEATLFTPDIDLTSYTSPVLSFNHAVNYCADITNVLAVEVHCDGEITTLSGFTWGTGTDWTFKYSGDIKLDDFAGKKIKIAFRYTSDGTSKNTSTWEIKGISVKATKLSTDIKEVRSEAFDPQQPHQIYTLSGQRLPNGSAYRGIVIVKQGNNTYKIRR